MLSKIVDQFTSKCHQSDRASVMYKRLIMLLFVVGGMFVSVIHAFAQVSHVSINSRQFDVGQQALLKMNLVVQNDDGSQLNFYTRQQIEGEMQQQKLLVQPINRFLVQLSGQHIITDTQAQLVVTVNRPDGAVLLAVLALFDAPLSFNSAQLAKAPTTSIPSVIANKPSPTRVGATSDNTEQVDVANEPTLRPQTPVNCQLIKEDSDTLWRIAERYKGQWNTSVYGAMLAIFEANMLAFSKQKIHLLLKNAPLNCPSPEILAQYDNKIVDKKVFQVIEAKHAAN